MFIFLRNQNRFRNSIRRVSDPLHPNKTHKATALSLFTLLFALSAHSPFHSCYQKCADIHGGRTREGSRAEDDDGKARPEGEQLLAQARAPQGQDRTVAQVFLLCLYIALITIIECAVRRRTSRSRIIVLWQQSTGNSRTFWRSDVCTVSREGKEYDYSASVRTRSHDPSLTPWPHAHGHAQYKQLHPVRVPLRERAQLDQDGGSAHRGGRQT